MATITKYASLFSAGNTNVNLNKAGDTDESTYGSVNVDRNSTVYIIARGFYFNDEIPVGSTINSVTIKLKVGTDKYVTLKHYATRCYTRDGSSFTDKATPNVTIQESGKLQENTISGQNNLGTWTRDELYNGIGLYFNAKCGYSTGRQIHIYYVKAIVDYTPPVFNISTSVSPSGVGVTSGDGAYTSGTTATLTATSTSNHYYFNHWLKDGIYQFDGWESSTVTVPVNGDATYTAVFSPNRYQITMTVSPNGSGSVSGGGTYSYGSTATLRATPATGYSFVKWQKDGVDDGNTSARRTITVSADATYTAVFELITYTVSTFVSPSGAGTVSGGGTYSSGSSATLTATPASGYHFTAWNDGDTSASRTITVQSSVSYTANFALNSYNITKTLSHATLSNSSTTVQHGSSYSSTVTADTDYALDTVTVTMGGIDITSTAYSNGSISIASVTGNISITVTTTIARLPEVSSVTISPNPVNAGQGLVLTVVFT